MRASGSGTDSTLDSSSPNDNANVAAIAGGAAAGCVVLVLILVLAVRASHSTGSSNKHLTASISASSKGTSPPRVQDGGDGVLFGTANEHDLPSATLDSSSRITSRLSAAPLLALADEPSVMETAQLDLWGPDETSYEDAAVGGGLGPGPADEPSVVQNAQFSLWGEDEAAYEEAAGEEFGEYSV